MSKDDFRDRLKSYSLEPEHGEWVKMEQLLDADKDDRRGFAWWKFGALFALLLIPVTIYLMSGTSKTEDFNHTSSSNFAAETSFDHNNSQEEIITAAQAIITTQEKQEIPTTITTSQNQIQNNTSNSSPTQNNRESVKTQNRIQTNTTRNITTPPTNNIFSRSQASNTSQSTTTKISNAALDHGEVLLAPEVELGQLLIAEMNTLEGLQFASLNTEYTNDFELPELNPVPFTKIYPEHKNKAWYFVAGVGSKYPLVDIQETQVGTYVPTQKFFPSYLAEAGIGKHFGKFSVEVGLAASLYQYKLEKSISETNLWGTQSGADGPEENIDRIEEDDGTFLINKFAVISPYLRGQYSFNLKKKFVLGIHSMISVNRKVDLPNQIVSDQFADGSNVATFEASTLVGAISESRRANINYDIGFSFEKLFAKRGRMAIDFSYGFATGSLEEGSYSVLRETTVDSNGAFSINGTGPKVKFRYYL